jgi:hypothetical protein
MCPFEGNWQSTSVFGGDALAITAAPERESGWEVQMVAMPAVSFGFVIERTAESTAECQCKIMLDQFTIAAGTMAESQDYISWDGILNNDVWEQATRRLEAKPDAKRNYEIKEDGSVVIFPRERRLQMQDVRMDFEFLTATDNDAVQLKGRFEEMELWQIEQFLRDELANTNFTIGSVYMASDFETETIVTPGRTTSWATRSADFWAWMPVSAVVAALFFT